MAAPTLETDGTTLRILDGTSGDPVTGNDVWDWNDGGGSSGGDGDVPVDGGGTEKVSAYITELIPNRVYRVNKAIQFGDGTTPSYFAAEGECWVIGAVIRTTANSVARFGIYNSGRSHSGCYIMSTVNSLGWVDWDGTIEFYATTWYVRSGLGVYFKFKNIVKISHLTIDGTSGFSFADIDTDNSFTELLRCVNSPLDGIIDIKGAASDVTIQDAGRYGLQLSTGGGGTLIEGITFQNNAENVEINWFTGQSWTLRNSVGFSGVEYGAGTKTGVNTLHEEYTFNLHIADKDGVDLEGVTVLCEDEGDSEVFSVETDGGGDIAEQNIAYKDYIYDGSASITTLSPHKFTLSKTGYETLVLEAVTVDASIVWRQELQSEIPVNTPRYGSRQKVIQ